MREPLSEVRSGAIGAWLVPLLLLGGLLCGCATVETVPASNRRADEARVCEHYFAALDRETAASGVSDAQAAPVAGYPFLRADRFLASFPPGTLSASEFSDWLDRLQALDQDGRRVEIGNLPRASRTRLAGAFGIAGDDPLSLASRAETCSGVLRHRVVDSVDLRYELWSRVVVPDDYVDWQRVVGLYPLTQIPFALGVRAWQRDTAREFATPLGKLPVQGGLVRYIPHRASTLGPAATAERLEQWSRNPLHIPQPPSEALREILLAYAPVFVVDTTSDDDRIGAVTLDSARGSRVATGEPMVYAYPSRTRWHGAVLLQLNYVFWFPARPSDGPFDILSGHLDGLLWRLTFAPDGTVLVADAIHNCGCYHLFFPSVALRPMAFGASEEERPFVPQPLPELAAGDRYALRIASRTHYIQRVLAVADASGTEYTLTDYDTLRALAAPGDTRRSLFGPDGIVPGTERGERFLFWPMGVPDPGAMRQRGHHATAFVGRRHFDDPWLIERSFESVGR